MRTRFFMLADLHVDERLATLAALKAGLARMVALAPDAAVVIDGDLTNRGTAAQFDAVWAALGQLPASMPVIANLGNHDVRGPHAATWTNDDTSAPAHWASAMAAYQAGTGRGGPPYFATVLGPVRWLVLNSERGWKDAAYFSPAQLTWLTGQLAEARHAGQLPFVLVHQALADTHWRSAQYGGIGPQAAALRQCLAQAPECFIWSGHLHNGLGVCEVIPRPYGTCIDLPAYSLSENGHVGRGLGYLVTVTEAELTLAAWDFAAGTRLAAFDRVIARLTLAAALPHLAAPAAARALMARRYDQRLYAVPETADEVAAPAVALYPPATLAQANAWIAAAGN